MLIYVLFVVLLAFQVYLNIAAYYALLQGMKNYSLFIVGIISLVFAGMFHLYRYGRALQKAPPPKPVPPAPSKPAVAPAPKPVPAVSAEKPLAAPPTASAKVGSEKAPQLTQKQKQAAGSDKAAAAPDRATSAAINGTDRKKAA